MNESGLTLISALTSLLPIVIVLVSIRGWLYAVGRWRRGEPLIQSERPLLPVPWGLVDLVCLVALYLMLQLAVAACFKSTLLAAESSTPDLSKHVAMLWVLLVANLAWVPCALGAQMIMRGADGQRLGWDASQLMRDLRLGGIAFCMLAVPVYAMQYFLVQWWPSKHPLIEIIHEHPDPLLLALGALTACVAAPLFEECAFRLFLQGWLQNIVLLWKRIYRMAHLTNTGDVMPSTLEGVWQRMLFGFHAEEITPSQPEEVDDISFVVPLTEQPAEENPYESPALSEPAPLPAPRLLVGPIVTSAAIFALLHFEHGPDWVPLFVLAVGLGYLYQRTQRLVPSMVVHTLLNTISYGMLLVQLYIGEK